MEFVLGFLSGTIVMIAFTLTFWIGNMSNKTFEDKEASNGKLEALERRKQKGINNIMSYDIDVALGKTEQLEE